MVKKQIKAKITNAELVKEKHKQIVEAASELFLEKGFHKASMRDIARESDIDLSYLYKYISTKDDILYLFYDYITSQYEPIYRMIESAKDEDPLILLKRALSLVMETIHNRAHEIQTLYTETRHLQRDSLHTVLARESEFIKIVEDLISRGVKDGIFNTKDSFMAANIVQLIIVIESLRGWNFRDRYNFADFTESIIDFIMAGLKVDEKKWQEIKK